MNPADGETKDETGRKRPKAVKPRRKGSESALFPPNKAKNFQTFANSLAIIMNHIIIKEDFNIIHYDNEPRRNQ